MAPWVDETVEVGFLCVELGPDDTGKLCEEVASCPSVEELTFSDGSISPCCSAQLSADVAKPEADKVLHVQVLRSRRSDALGASVDPPKPRHIFPGDDKIDWGAEMERWDREDNVVSTFDRVGVLDHEIKSSIVRPRRGRGSVFGSVSSSNPMQFGVDCLRLLSIGGGRRVGTTDTKANVVTCDFSPLPLKPQERAFAGGSISGDSEASCASTTDWDDSLEGSDLSLGVAELAPQREIYLGRGSQLTSQRFSVQSQLPDTPKMDPIANLVSVKPRSLHTKQVTGCRRIRTASMETRRAALETEKLTPRGDVVEALTCKYRPTSTDKTLRGTECSGTSTERSRLPESQTVNTASAMDSNWWVDERRDLAHSGFAFRSAKRNMPAEREARKFSKMFSSIARV